MPFCGSPSSAWLYNRKVDINILISEVSFMACDVILTISSKICAPWNVSINKKNHVLSLLLLVNFKIGFCYCQRWWWCMVVSEMEEHEKKTLNTFPTTQKRLHFVVMCIMIMIIAYKFFASIIIRLKKCAAIRNYLPTSGYMDLFFAT